MSETESRGTLRFALFAGLSIAIAVLVLSLVVKDERSAPADVDAAMGWVVTWLGILFVLLAPIVAIWLLRTQDLAWVVLPPSALFLAGAALIGLGAWGPFVGLVSVVLSAAAIVIWRPSDDEAS